MKKKGFTLIELLAVIVIIALIALVVIPYITNTIDKAKKASFRNSVMIGSRELDNYSMKHEEFTYGEGQEVTVEELKEVLKHKFRDGKYIIKGGIVESWYITDGTYCAKGKVSELEISKDCYKLDDTDVELDMNKITLTTYPDSAVLVIEEGFAKDNESGIKEYRVSLYEGNNKIETQKKESEGIYTFSDLDVDKTYKIVVAVENGNGIVKSIVLELDKPSYTVSPIGFSRSKKVNIIYPVGYINEYSIDDGETWEEYEGELTLEKNGSVVARLKKGDMYINGSSEVISTIDRSEPTVSNVVELERTSNSIKVKGIGVDNESGIYGYQFSKDNGATWSGVQTSDEYTFSGLDKSKYEIKVRAINGTYVNDGLDNNYTESATKVIPTTPKVTPTYSTSPEGYAQSKTVTIDYKDEENAYTHLYSLDDGATWNTYEGSITFNENGSVVARTIDDKENYIDGSSYTVSEIDNSAPTEASIQLLNRTSKSITVRALGTDNESDIYGYQFKLNNGSYSSVQTGSDYTFNDLSYGEDGNYTIYVKAVNNTYPNNEINNKNSKETTTVIRLIRPETPTYTVSPEGWAQSKTVTIDFKDTNKYTHEYSLDDGKTWHTYTEPIVLNENGSVQARVYDGTNYVTASSQTVSEIDNTPPVCELVVAEYDTNKVIKLRANCTDNESGIANYKFTSNNGTDWTDKDLVNTISYNSYKLSEMKAKVTNGANEQTTLQMDENSMLLVYADILDKYDEESFLIQHPIGSIYKTTSSDEDTASKMETKYGGTWEAYGTDRVLRGTTGTAGETNGSSTVTLTTDNLPEHNHSIPALSGTAASTGSGYTIGHTYSDRTISSSGAHTHSTTKSSTTSMSLTAGSAGGHSHNVTNYSGTVLYSQNTETGGSGSTCGMNYTWTYNTTYLLKTSTDGAHTHTVTGTINIPALSVASSGAHTHSYNDYYANSITGVEAHTHNVTTNTNTSGNTGTGESFSVLDSYETVYVYRRIG